MATNETDRIGVNNNSMINEWKGKSETIPKGEKRVWASKSCKERMTTFCKTVRATGSKKEKTGDASDRCKGMLSQVKNAVESQQVNTAKTDKGGKGRSKMSE
jgi:hypothetical protein